MKTFKEFISEANRPKNANDIELARWNKVKARHDAMSDEEKSARIIGVLGRDKSGNQRYGFKNKESRRNQGKNRNKKLAFIDSDLDDGHTDNTKKSPSQKGKFKADLIKSRGKEHHHLTSIDQSAKEFAGLTPEQRRAKREKDAQSGKFHGSDPRNIAQTDGPGGGKGIPHRGTGGYHSRQKPVGSGGSIQDFGSDRDRVWIQTRAQRQGRVSKQKPKNTGAAERMSAAYDAKVDRAVNS